MKHTYNVKVIQAEGGKGGQEGRVGTLRHPTNPNFPQVTIQSPAEFKGPASPEGQSLHWTPEDLFVSSIAVCLFTTFVSFAEKSHLEYSSFEIDATGTLEKVEDVGLLITKVQQEVYITVPNEQMRAKAEKMLEKSERYCLIANSVKTKVTYTSHISIQ